MGSVTRGVRVLLLASAITLGIGRLQSAFGQQSTFNSVEPPAAYVVIDGKTVDMKINGYQWSVKDGRLTRTTVADAAFHPARNLKSIAGTRGSTANLTFQQKPNTIQLVMWEQSKRIHQHRMNSTKFTLPNTSGDYTYEIIANWGKDYVEYDFEALVH